MATNPEIEAIARTLEFISDEKRQEFPTKFQEWLNTHTDAKAQSHQHQKSQDTNEALASIYKHCRALLELFGRPESIDALNHIAKAIPKDSSRGAGVLNQFSTTIASLKDAAESAQEEPKVTDGRPPSGGFERWAVSELGDLYVEATGKNPAERQQESGGYGRYGPFKPFAMASLKLLYGGDYNPERVIGNYIRSRG